MKVIVMRLRIFKRLSKMNSSATRIADGKNLNKDLDKMDMRY